MNICILNGSPKGENSVTMQYMAYYRKCFPEHRFTYVKAAQQCRKFEKDREAFFEVMAEVDRADLIIWAFPLYIMCVHSQYKRFIELIFERNAENRFEGKYAVSFSTSINFFDNTAHEYIHGICDDLGMNYIDGVPAHMRTLMEKEKLAVLQNLFLRWERYVARNLPAPRMHPEQKKSGFTYSPRNDGVQAVETDKKAVLVADLEENETNLKGMTDRVKKLLPDIEIMDIRSLSFGPCLGCLKCGPDNICAYAGKKDEFLGEFRNKVADADIVIFAGAMHDRYLSSVWQRFAERCFFRTHQPYLAGRQVAFLISGPLSQNDNARQILTAYTEVWEANLGGFVSDECEDETGLSAMIDNLVYDLAAYADSRTVKPQSFLGHAGMKVFRDDIFGPLRLVFQADHRYYRRHGIYDFPQRRIGTRLLNFFAIPLTRLPFIKKAFRRKFRSVMTMPYRRIIARAERLV
jgi:multimeric flavodoxin WrbA